jgi:hypothetical protein
MSRGLAAIAALAVAGTTAGAVVILVPADDSGVGQTISLVREARWPVKWHSNEEIEFETWVGTALASTDGSVVEQRDPDSDPSDLSSRPPIREVLEIGRQYGKWRSGGDRLFAGDNETCGPPLLLSPDRRFVACQRIVTDPLRETSEGFGTIVRVR